MFSPILALSVAVFEAVPEYKLWRSFLLSVMIGLPLFIGGNWLNSGKKWARTFCLFGFVANVVAVGWGCWASRETIKVLGIVVMGVLALASLVSIYVIANFPTKAS